jgi:iron complex outermembrane receptor protein
MVNAAMLEEIIVTAQKKSQVIRDVPISISLTTGETLDKMSIRGFEELSASIPNVTIAENATQDSVTIRGIGSGANHGFEQSVGTFVDGVYFGRGRSSRSPFLDIESVEILKGPQGVLFGKNTIAGALNISTREPTYDFEGSIEGEYFEADDSWAVTAIVSGPLSETVAGRLVVKRAESDGFVDNITTGKNEPEKEESFIRASLAWDASDKLNVAAKFESSSYDVVGRSMQLVEAGPFLGLYQSVDPNFEQKLDYKRSVTHSAFESDYDDTEAQNATITVRYDLENVSFVSVSAYVGYEYDNSIPANFAAGIDTAAKGYDEEFSQFSQELRLESNSDGNFEYNVGVFYQTEEVDHLQDFAFDTTQGRADGFPLPPFVGVTQFDLVQDTDSLAIFGQGTWHFSDAVRATFGLRYTKDEKDMDFVQRTTGSLPFPNRAIEDKREDTSTTPSLNVQWDITDNTMVYASYSEGFKSGGFDFESAGQFEEETVEAYEFGLKSSLLDGAAELNVAYFNSEFEDLQVSAWNGQTFITGNAATSITKGVEIDGRWQLTDSLLLTGAVAFTDASYDDFTNAVCNTPQQLAHGLATGLNPNTCQQDLSGKPLQFAPDWAGNVGLEYVSAMESGLEWTVNLDVNFSDNYFTALDLDPVSEQDSFTKVNLRIQLASDEDTWSVALLAKNLTDEKTTNWVNDVPFFRGAYFGAIDPPRSVGIQGKYRF